MMQSPDLLLVTAETCNIKQLKQSFQLLAGQLFPRMPHISGCDLNIMHHFETASMTVDSAGERHMAGLAEISLKDGNELGSHMWHSLCNLCIQLWSLPCSKDLC